MTKEGTLHFVLALMCLMLPVVSMLLPDAWLSWVNLFCPFLFFAILCGILTSPVYGFLTGALAPLLVWLLRQDTEFLPSVLTSMISCASAGLMAGICYEVFLFSFGAAFAALLTSWITLGLSRLVICLCLKMSYKFTDYLDEAAVGIWPGIIACMVLIPLITALFRRIGVMQVLHRKTDYNR